MNRGCSLEDLPGVMNDRERESGGRVRENRTVSQTWFLWSIFIAITVSLGRAYANSISSIFSLCIESNAFEKSESNSVASKKFCSYSFDDLTNSQNLSCCGSIPPKTVLIFLKIFLNFKFDTVEKQSIINSYRSKSYVSVALGKIFLKYLQTIHLQIIYTYMYKQELAWNNQ